MKLACHSQVLLRGRQCSLSLLSPRCVGTQILQPPSEDLHLLQSSPALRVLRDVVLEGKPDELATALKGLQDFCSRGGVQGRLGELKEAVLSGDDNAYQMNIAELRSIAQRFALDSSAAAEKFTYDFEARPSQINSSSPAASEQRRLPNRAAIREDSGELRPEDFVWSGHAFNDGEDGNARILRSFEDEYAALVASTGGHIDAPGLLRATLDLAGAYVKNYSLDKADLLLDKVVDVCRKKGMPWDIKCLQDLATLRFKQHRQPECAKLLEELACRSPQNAALQENLGTVYNSIGDHQRALECFEEAVTLRGGLPHREDLWNIALAKKNLGNFDAAIRNMLSALELYTVEAKECPVTIGKVHDSLADCYLAADCASQAVPHYQAARSHFAQNVGVRSPLYGAACDGLSKSLHAVGEEAEAYKALVECIEVSAAMDAIHPTPLYEQLQRALDAYAQEPSTIDIRRLAPAVQVAVLNLSERQLDTDGNGGVVLQKLAQVLLESSDMEAKEGRASKAHEWRLQAVKVLRRAKVLMEDATEAGEADLSELCVIAAMQIGLTEARLAM